MSSVENIKKGLSLSRPLLVSSIIIGEPYSGKMTLVRSIYPNAVYVDAKEFSEVETALANHQEVVIYNFEYSKNIAALNFQNHRVIAIANSVDNMKLIEEKFAFIYFMPPLRERKDEVKKLAREISSKIKDELMLDGEIEIDYNKLDLSQNFKSFKISLYKELIKKSLTTKDIEEVLYDYFLEHLDEGVGYSKLLPLFEVPLIKAGLYKFGSQLKLSKILELNRNTLRKKINEHNIN